MKNRMEGRNHPDKTLGRMEDAAIQPKHQILDNEATREYRKNKSNMTYQLVPPEDHQRNVAEKAIQI